MAMLLVPVLKLKKKSLFQFQKYSNSKLKMKSTSEVHTEHQKCTQNKVRRRVVRSTYYSTGITNTGGSKINISAPHVN